MTYDFTAALVRGLGGHVRQVRVDRLVEGVQRATFRRAEQPGVRCLADARRAGLAGALLRRQTV